MNEVKGPAWKEPPIEGTRNPTNETRTKIFPIVFLQFLMESWEGLENGVEIIAWKVIEEDKQFGQGVTKLAIFVGYGVDDVGDNKKGVGT